MKYHYFKCVIEIYTDLDLSKPYYNTTQSLFNQTNRVCVLLRQIIFKDVTHNVRTNRTVRKITNLHVMVPNSL